MFSLLKDLTLPVRQRVFSYLLNGSRLKNVKFGKNTITLSPAGVGDVARWSATQDAVAAGDIGMNTTTGRPKGFINSAVRDLAEQDAYFYRQVGTSPNRRYPAGVINSLNAGTGSPSHDTLRALPFFTTRGGTIDRIMMEVTVAGGAGSSTRIGIYEATSPTNLVPSARVLDSGAIDTTSTGVKDVTVSQVLTPNRLYWFVHITASAVPRPTVRTPGGLDGVFPIFGIPSTFGANVGFGVSRAFAFAALPDPFGAATIVDTTTTNFALVGVRYSV